ncbi:hypothetical protein M409DRAFT_54300 [Zasmidium cellare ATCC 36951]|uniref:Glutaminase A n=1 Tax=Zasmidium cellare ATCC 36951 TaxID=1080233 RepID=A0A6A6CIP8_ZASCE|nr:uncharacterized protein M409DRAFT_54300 [Zasmidium cellare ATCC 36951]KAF2167094.1 hypothetical protein M409DRAFT_54300 [Zasmidium cellare ATCC 36951]
MWTKLVLASIAALCGAQSTFSPLRPPSLPLAVRSPYMSTWQQAGSNGGNGGYLAGQWPTFWAGQITGWTGYIRVDNITYTWMGAPNVTGQTNYYVVQTGYEYTPTSSIFTLDVAGQVELTATFLSPVLPESLLQMSLPYSYLTTSVRSLDGRRHNVQLYTDISAEWVSGVRDSVAQWSYGTSDSNVQPNAVEAVQEAAAPAPGPLTTYATHTQYQLKGAPTHTGAMVHASSQGVRPSGVAEPPLNATTHTNAEAMVNARAGGVAYHRVWRQTQLEFTDLGTEQAEWGYWYYATDNTRNLTHQQGSDISVRTQFIRDGFLANTQDTNYRPINQNYPVFGFAHNMGVIGKNGQKNHTFQLSLHQQNCILFEEAAGNTSVPCLWTSYFNQETDAVEYFYNQYSNISAASEAFDSKVEADSKASGGDDYYALTALATRQAFGALEYTNKPSQPWIFLKEISSDGDIQTVDVIFPFFPIIIYTNPKLLKYLLDPLFINQEAGYWPYAFSIHDLGHFPNATGYNNLQVNVEQQPVEECGNMLIMALAYAQRTGDNAYLAQHYSILRQWNEYLVNDSLIPESQLSTDDFLGAVQNDTNLALKGIVGIEAMAQIANRTGHTTDGVNYTGIAHSYIKKWQNYGVNFQATPPHSETQYGNTTTYSLLYNLYGDALLGLQLVPKRIYNIQSNFYPTVFQRYGVPLRSSFTATKADWELWCAAIASASTKNQFISIITTYLDQTPSQYPFSDLYDTGTGEQYFSGASFVNRPVVGGIFAPLALEGAPTSGTVTPISLAKAPSKE